MDVPPRSGTLGPRSAAGTRLLRVEPFTREAFAPFGDVVRADEGGREIRTVNDGTATRRNFVCDVPDLRPGRSKLNLATFRCAAREPWPFGIRMLEKHPRSAQLFVPMSEHAYVIVVAEGSQAPDPATLRAFLALPRQGVSYRPDVWHHPMIALGGPADFACLVWEDGGDEDCLEHHFDPGAPIVLERPLWP